MSFMPFIFMLKKLHTYLLDRFCKMHLLCVRESVLKDPFRAQLRKEDVRATEKDKVEMYKSFRPGDVVLARVLRDAI